MLNLTIRVLAAGVAVALLAIGDDATSQPALDPNDASSTAATNPFRLGLPSLTPPTATPAPKQASPAGKYLGQLSANRYATDSTANPYGAHGSPYSPESVTNPTSRYGSPYSNESVTNPTATDAPKIYDSQGHYRGKLSANPYDPESTSNPYGRYGSPYSPDSINNPYGAGNPYATDSPTNPYGKGLSIYDAD